MVPFVTLRVLALGVLLGPSHTVPAPLAGLTVALGPPTEVFLWVGFLACGALDVVVFTFPLLGIGLRTVIFFGHNHA